MKAQIEDPDESVSDFLTRVLKTHAIENQVTEIFQEKANQINEKKSIDAIKIRQLEQKLDLVVGLTRLLFKRFEELHPSQRFSKFEFTDISWYADRIRNN